MKEQLREYMLQQLQALVGIDSTTGFCYAVEAYIKKQFEEMGYAVKTFNRGGLLIDLGGSGEGIVLSAHADDIGLMVRRILPDGTLQVVQVGGLRPEYADLANVRVHTRAGAVYTGTVRRKESSIHVNPIEKFSRETSGGYDTNLVVVLDKKVSTEAETLALGIRCGDIIALEPNFMLADDGYIKSRFLDDKACVALLMTLAREAAQGNLSLSRHTYVHIAVTEETGMGAAYGLPEDITEFLALDIGCVSPGQYSSEHKACICARDARWPYDYSLISKLCRTGDENGINYAIDIYNPSYGSDVAGVLASGRDVRGGVVGPGVLTTHGYERTNICALENTYGLIEAYIR